MSQGLPPIKSVNTFSQCITAQNKIIFNLTGPPGLNVSNHSMRSVDYDFELKVTGSRTHRASVGIIECNGTLRLPAHDMIKTHYQWNKCTRIKSYTVKRFVSNLFDCPVFGPEALGVLPVARNVQKRLGSL